MRGIRDWVRQYAAGRISRRNFVECAAAAGMSLTATASALAQADRGKSVAKNYNQTNLNPYEEWRKTEGIPVYADYFIADVRTVKLEPWKRLGVLGAYIDFKGGEGVNDGYICEIPPG